MRTTKVRMENLASIATSPKRGSQARTAILVLLTVLSLGLLVVAKAGARVKIVAPKSVQAPERVHFSANPSSPTEKMVFYVDGHRRWVDRSPNWKFGHNGSVSLRPGRHVLKVRAVQPNRIVITTRTTYVEEPASDSGAPGGGGQNENAPESSNPEAPPVQDPVSSLPDPTPAPKPSPSPISSSRTLLSAGFENGLANWNIAGVGEVVPTIESSDVRSGAHAARVVLTGSQNRSELSLGGTGTSSDSEMIRFQDGVEYWYGFSFNIQKMVWGHPGAHNLIMQFKSEGTGSPEFGLQLWDYAGDDGHSGGKGLWSNSNPDSRAPGGDRFLAPVGEDEWHDVAIHFKASDSHEGFYEIFLDGHLVETRSNVTMIVPGRSFAYIKDGLYRNGQTIPGTSEILLDDAKLGTSASSVQPG
jgi:hypothetical protein